MFSEGFHRVVWFSKKFKGDLIPKLHQFLWHTIASFIEKEPCTKFDGVLLNFHEHMKLPNFERSN